MIKGILLLSDSSRYHGELFGYIEKTQGEVVFQTGMVGYTESLSDPSYKSQLLVLTYPIIGNYGVPDRDDKDRWGLLKSFESEKIHANGLIVNEYSTEFSNWAAKSPLSIWLTEQKVVGISGIDTRHLTRKLRDFGSMTGLILPLNVFESFETIPTPVTNPELFVDPNELDLALEVSMKGSQSFNDQGIIHVCIIDCGIKFNQIRCFCKIGAKVTVVHINTDINPNDYDALFISNGPGNPVKCIKTISTITKWLSTGKPLMGICLGHQLLAIAIGCSTYKMVYGNRGHNQPATHLPTERCFMTSQNHGFAVDAITIPSQWRELFKNENDKSNEGIIHKSLPFVSVQFHPEHMSGPADTEFLFELFLSYITELKASGKVEMTLDQRITNYLTYKKNDHELELFGLLKNKPKKILILGSGGLSIGQAGEFDYSGAQALKALREEQIETVLVNPNIATVQTTTGMADKSYMVPITLEYVTEIIKMERPDGVYLTFGGQTGLNCGVQLEDKGILKKYGVTVLGTSIESIKWTEDRQLFADKLAEINEKVAPSMVAYTVQDCLSAGETLGYPVMIRAAFALGGLGSGFANNATELQDLALAAFAHTSQILVDKSLRGWKEIEYEVVRDLYNNCITVVNMENIDPLGIHTGESIVVSPSQTLSNFEYNMLRTCAIKVVRFLGIVGECNIQYALDPESHQYYIIEVNARLSRSSALASKATGYPLAYIAAKLGLGFPLPYLKNSVTKSTTACFEPSIDYCVVKIPRWDLNKFTKVCNKISTQMKSVGEVMAVGRGFEEAFQKALRMVDEKNNGFDPYVEEFTEDKLSSPTDRRILVLANALKQGLPVKKIYELTRIDKWFLYKFSKIIKCLSNLESYSFDKLTRENLLLAKKLGFSDKQISIATKCTEMKLRTTRINFGIKPYVHQIDTVSAEWPCSTNYLYLSYSGLEHDITFAGGFVMVLGSGVYRIGSSVEFDWCAVQCINELANMKRKTIMLNYNPETVSTDYDMCDHLFFEEISLESVLDIYQIEKPDGVIVCMGGQLPNNISMGLHREKVKILGTSPVCIDNAENRFKFSRMLDSVGMQQPRWKELTDLTDAVKFCKEVEYPCLVRPSYVLSGAAMNVAFEETDLVEYLNQAVAVNKDHPVVISKFIEAAKEIDVDGVAFEGKLLKWAVSEHVENAGVHSGDATLVTPPQDMNEETLQKISLISKMMAEQLKVSGPFNMQLIAKDNKLMVIECNLRVSRSFPFVSKALNYDMIAAATRAVMGEPLCQQGSEYLCGDLERVAVKSPVFSFSRLPGADVLLGVEMSSTGEVGCFGIDRYEAFLKAQLASGASFPQRGSTVLLSIGSYRHKMELIDSVKILLGLGYKLIGSIGTAEFYEEHGITIKSLDWINDETTATISVESHIRENKIQLLINLPKRNSGLRRASAVNTPGYRTRRLAIEHNVTLITNVKIAKMFIVAIKKAIEKKEIVAVSTITDCISSQKIYRFPGLIDVHVHVRDPGQTHKEDWSSCTRAAISGGITTILAMPNTDPTITDKAALNLVKVLAAKSAYCNYGIFLGASSTNQEQLVSLAHESIGLKMYLNPTFSTLQMHSFADWKKHLETFPTTKPICCHAESETLAAILLLAKFCNRAIHICHVSRKHEIELIREAKLQGINVTCEVTPHHLFLTEEDLEEGLKNVKPNLATEEDRQALWDNMDIIDCIATDHAPHTWEEKNSEKPPPGFPGLETMLPLLLDAHNRGLITLDQIVERLSTNPRKIFNISLEEEETWVEVNLNEQWCIGKSSSYETKCNWSPFHGRSVTGKVKRVMLNGNLIFVDGKFLTEKGIGKNVVCKMSTLPTTPKRIRLSSGLSTGAAENIQSNRNRFFSTSYSDEKADGKGLVVKRPESPVLKMNLTDVFHRDLSGQNYLTVVGMDKSSLNHLLNIAHNMYVNQQQQHQLPMTSSTSTSQSAQAKIGGDYTCSTSGAANQSTKSIFSLGSCHNQICRGKVLSMMFYEPSTRTSCSFQSAMLRLGGSVMNFNESDSSVNKGESLEDTIRMMSAYSHCLIVRHPEKGAISQIANVCSCPIINAGDGAGEHPTQALLDVFTIREEFGTVNNLTITLVGDLQNGRTVHSLARLLCLYNVKLAYVPHLPELGMPVDIQKYIEDRGLEQKQYSCLEDVLAESDVVYMTRVQRERLHDIYDDSIIKEAIQRNTITPELMIRAKKKMIVMHPLPRLSEIDPSFDLDPRAAYFRQAEYGLYVRMSLLATIMGYQD